MKRIFSLLCALVCSAIIFGFAQSWAEESSSGNAIDAVQSGGSTFEAVPNADPAPLPTIVVDLTGLPAGETPLEMVLIPAGTFMMGSPPSERGRSFSEGPQHEVTITKPFYIGKYELTEAQWRAIMGSNPPWYVSRKPNRPVETIHWNDCQALIEQLNTMGLGTFRLPTEAEWEYACRAGTSTRFSFGDALECPDTPEYCELYDRYMWYQGNRTEGSTLGEEVGQKRSNPWGLYDMHGNVLEYCQDWYGPCSAESQTDPQGPSSGSYRTMRGGFWGGYPTQNRSAARSQGPVNDRGYYVGMRLVRLADSPSTPAPTPTPTSTNTPTATSTPTPPPPTPTPTLTFTPTATATPSPADPPSSGEEALPTLLIDVPGLSTGAQQLEMAKVPAGIFTMGIDPDPDNPFLFGFESPAHEVTITEDYYIGTHEITQEQWKTVMGNNPSFEKDADKPVTVITWYDCIRFCNRLSQLAGRTPVYDEGTWQANWDADGFRLPTEAEWERACRAGTTTTFYWGDDPDAGSEDSPNPWGLYGMAGGPWEWCWDFYAEYSDEALVDPKGPKTGNENQERVERGGMFPCPSAVRLMQWPDSSWVDIGLRLAMNVTDAGPAPTPTPSGYLFTENFDSGSPIGWRTTDGNWFVTEPGIYNGMGNGEFRYREHHAYYDYETFSDFYYSCDIHYQGGLEYSECAITFRRRDDGTMYVLYFSKVGEWEFYKMIDGGRVSISEVKQSPYLEDGWNTLAVNARGNRFDIFINSEHVGSYEDNSLSSGKVGLLVMNDIHAQFDNVAVENAKSSLPFTSTPTPTPAVSEPDLMIAQVRILDRNTFEEISTADLNQPFLSGVVIKNIGNEAISDYHYECNFDGQLLYDGDIPDSLGPNEDIWITWYPWFLGFEEAGRHTIEWNVTAAGDDISWNDSQTVVFHVGEPEQGFVPFQVYGEGLVEDAAYSPTGKQIVTGGTTGWANLWDIKTGKTVRRFFGHTQAVNAVAFSPDGTKVLTGSSDGTAKLWAADTGRELRTFTGHNDAVLSVAFSPDGKRILTGSADSSAWLWNVETGEVVEKVSHYSTRIMAVAFSPDGKRMLTGAQDNTAILWNAETGREIRTLKTHTNWVSAVAFSPGGNSILTGSYDMTAMLWDSETGAEIRRFTGHPYWVTSVAFSPDGQSILTGSKDSTAKLWNRQTGEEIRDFDGHTEEIVTAEFSPDGETILTASKDTRVILWDAKTAEQQQTLEGHTDKVYSVRFSGDGSRILMGSYDNTASLWNTMTGERIRTFVAHSDHIESAVFSPDEKKILTSSWDRTAKLWDAETGEEIRTFSGGHTNVVSSVAFSPDGESILTASWDETIKLWDIDTGEVIRTYTGHTGSVKTVHFTRDGSKILSCGADHTARLWDTKTGDLIRTFKGHSDLVKWASFSPDETKILTGAWDGFIKLWDVETGEEIFTITAHDAAFSVAFSPDGSKIVSGSAWGIVKMWDVETGRELRTYTSHTDCAYSLAFTPDGTKLLTGGHDGTARLWEVDTPRVLIVAGGEDSPENALREQTKALAAYAYSVCRARGYDKSDIRWLSAFEEEQDADGDLVNDIFAPATRENLSEALSEWSTSDLTSSGRRLLVYMVDHGLPMPNDSGERDTYFYLNGRETISGAELDSWLDDLAVAYPEIDVSLVVECCHSGAFVEQCAPPEGTQRLVVSSTNYETEATILPPPDLTSFSSIFWGAAYMGATMVESVNAASGFFSELFEVTGQRPLFDDNGDGRSDEHDGLLMGQNRFGRSWAYAGHGSGEFPAFEDVYPPEDEIITVSPGSSLEISAQILPGQNPEEVWAVVRPPAPQTIAGKAITLDQSLRRVQLVQDAQDPSLWRGSVENLSEEGVYVVSFTAHFPFNRLSRAQVTRFRVSTELSPEETLDIRALLTVGGGEIRPFAQDMADYSLEVCSKRGYRDADIRVLGRDFPTTRGEFLDALNALAISDSSDKDLRLFIYLVGDCSSDGVFYFDDNETIAATELIGMLDDLQGTHSLLEVILLVDSPHAGKFVEANAGAVSGKRVVIAGTSGGGKGLFVQSLSLTSFSRYFLSNARQGKDLWASYDQAYVSLVDRLRQNEGPQLDDNGDGQTTFKDGGDGALASKWYIGRRGSFAGAGAASLPTLLAASEFSGSVTGDVSVWVDVLQASVPERVWVSVLPLREEGLHAEALPEIELTREAQTWRWSGRVPESSFGPTGDYVLVFYASYADGRVSEPLTQPIEMITNIVATPTPAERPTPTPTMTPTPPPTPTNVLFTATFDQNSVGDAGLIHNPATGFEAASIAIGDVPSGKGTNERGVAVEAEPGEGVLAILNSPVNVRGESVLISVYARADSEECSVALAALNAPIDGQLAYTNAGGGDVPVGEWKKLNLIYNPPSGALQPGIQVAVPETASGAANVYFDNLTVSLLAEEPVEDIALDVDGSFDGDTSGLLKNVNGDTGSSLVFPSPEGGKGVLLTLMRADDAANIGIFASQLQGGFPHVLRASVDAELFAGTGGVTALVMTNGYGNVGVFVNNSELADQQRISVGGIFFTENSTFPVLCVVQNGGPGVGASVLMDNLELKKIEGAM